MADDMVEDDQLLRDDHRGKTRRGICDKVYTFR